MNINRVGMKIFVFCLTFFCGFLTVGLFAENDDEFNSKDMERVDILKTPDDLSQIQVQQQTKLPCRENFNQEYVDLLRVKSEIKKLLADETQTSQNQKSIRRKFDNLEREIKSLNKLMAESDTANALEKFHDQLRAAHEREIGVHTLLYVENCAEYNEPR